MRLATPDVSTLIRISAAALLLLLSAVRLVAQTLPEDVTRVAQVVVDGTVLFDVSGTSGLPADERARNVAGRIVDVARQLGQDDVEMTISPTELGQSIVANGTQIMIVTQTDADREDVARVDTLATVYANRIRAAILDWRDERSTAAIEQGLRSVLLWTAGFVAVTALLLATDRWLRRYLEKRVERYLSRVEEATQAIVRARAVAGAVSMAFRGLLILLFLFTLYYYVSVILFAFPQTRGLATVLLGHVTAPVLGAGHAIVDFLPDLVVLILIFLGTRSLVRLARVTFENIEAGTVRLRGFEKHWVWPSFNIVRALLIVSALVLAYPYIPGSDSTAFKGISILLGVMVSIGSNSVVSNVLAGLFVIYRRSTNIGDLIKVGEHTGEVTAIKLTETHLVSYKNELISIPNAQLLGSDVVNYTQKVDGRGLIVHTAVGIGYDEPHGKIEALLIEAAQRTGGINRSPAPFVLRTELGDFSVTYEINAFTARGDMLPRILSDLHGHILELFHGAGVQIMSPHYMADPATPKIPAVDAARDPAA